MEHNAAVHIVQVVGYKNSGKTTLSEILIKELTFLGYKVGTIKHHGHGGKPNQVRNTDSYIHKEAGAVISAVQGENDWLISYTAGDDFTLETMIMFYEQAGMDMILIEGFKQADYRKIALVKDETELGIVDQLTNVQAVGGFTKPKLETNHLTFSIPSFQEAKHDIIKLILSGE